MSYIESNLINGTRYLYFVKKLSISGNNIRIKKFIGKENSQITKEEFLKKNLNELTLLEYKKRAPLLEAINQKLYNTKTLHEMEKNTILLSNHLESRKAEEEFFNVFAKEFIFNSNNIEGSKIPREKVIEIIEKGNTKYENRNEVKEVKNSIIAFQYLQDDFKFNQKSLMKLYSLLTSDLKREDGADYPAGFKKIDIIVGNSITTKPNQVKKEIRALFDWHKANKKKIHPLELAFEFHLRYESIHPFIDANGRTGRMLMNKILMQNYYLPIIIRKESKMAYFNSIEKAREGKKQKYYQFLVTHANKTYKELIKLFG